MTVCSKCGGNTRFIKAVSKKTGEPFQANVCQTCKNFDFINAPKAEAKAVVTSGNGNIEILKLAVQLALKSEMTSMLGADVYGYYLELKDILNGGYKPEAQKGGETTLQDDSCPF
jgi:hypothetical protein